MKKLIAALALCLTATAAQATVINFDDIGGQTFVPTNYSGFNWDGGWGSNSWVLGTLGGGTDITQTYNINGTHSGTNYAWSNGGTSLYLGNNSTFDLNSVWVAGGYNNPLTIRGFNNGVQTYTQTFNGISGTWQQVALNFNGVDNVTFSYQNNLFIDDISVNESAPVPEPSTLILLGAGLVGLGFARKRFAKK